MRTVLAGLAAGIVFLVLDGVLNANPLARQLYAVYQPIARPSVNALAGSAIDLAYGLVLALLYARLRPSLPGRTGLGQALSFGLIVWFLRVAMRVGGEWVTTAVPPSVHAYTLVAGLVQVLLVAVLIAALLPPQPRTGR